MSLSREAIRKVVDQDLKSAREAADEARRFAVECAQNNSISGSGERAVAEQQSDSWTQTVSRLESLRSGISGNAPSRVSLGAMAEIDMDGDSFTVVMSDTAGCHLSNEEITVVSPNSPLGQALMDKGSGSTVQYTLGERNMMSARIKRVF